MAFAFSNSKPLATGTREEIFKSVFDPIVKPEMRESWNAKWKDWFVTTNEIRDERKPGKVTHSSHSFISNFSAQTRIFIHKWRICCFGAENILFPRQ